MRTQEAQDGTMTCSFCDELGHVQTNGPGGIKLVQYFACKKFTQMSPQQRFQTLRAKGLCFQCLFPGAESNKGKHNEGYCQREFACKHLSHEKTYSCVKNTRIQRRIKNFCSTINHDVSLNKTKWNFRHMQRKFSFPTM